MNQASLSDFVAEKVFSKKISKSELAIKAKLSRGALYKILNGETTDLKMSTLVNLAHALEEHPLVLMRCYLPQHRYYPKSSKTHQPGDASSFIRDVSIPDNTVVTAGSYFVKTWEIQNIGKVHWENRKLVCMDDQFEVTPKPGSNFTPHKNRLLIPDQYEIAIPLVKPGEKVQLSVGFTCPEYPTSVISIWKMADMDNSLFLPEYEGLACQVQVVAI